MSKIQVIEKRGRRFALVPLMRYRTLLKELEMLEDIRAYDAAKARDDGTRVPAAVVDAMLDETVHPIRAWRDRRGLTQQHLADAAGISKPFLCQIESRTRNASVTTLRRLGTALDVPIDLLT